MPAHKHTGTAASASLTGKLKSYYAYGGTGVNGIVNAYRISGAPTAENSSSNTNDATIDATHNHTVTINNTGGGKSYNNMPPYLTVYMFKRTE